MIGIIYWDDSGSDSPADQLVTRLTEAWAGLRQRMASSGGPFDETAEGSMAEIVRDDGRWLIRRGNRKTEIHHCPCCGRELPAAARDPNQLRLELAE